MPGPERSFVVTGGCGGVGAAVAARLDGFVVTLDVDPSASVVGDAGDLAVATRAAALAESVAPLAGWVNCAAVFRDAWLHGDDDVLPLIVSNLAMAVTGCTVAVRTFGRRGGAIVNVTSHQAARPVPGALPYATAKAAVEGLTRAVAVDYGSWGVRCNAVALGSIRTSRLENEEALAALHPLGRVGEPAEVADVVAGLLAPGFISGAVIPVDGGRAALGHDPEARWPVSGA
jgi:NAD(P)-dependent dehydrogenase (short-subunit alcohol dehydrogenase family)